MPHPFARRASSVDHRQVVPVIHPVGLRPGCNGCRGGCNASLTFFSPYLIEKAMLAAFADLFTLSDTVSSGETQ